ncbi:uncharacterized protein LOC128201363 isoform X1 [Galleria mellonella]|uniref:Uncharacterized protein LOC128201363 isoform X1 n=1 Tax=Galleria mellonella TaxID=7137 RepID=A0ABM3MRU8_GALME|nr:uncharacterized protein LOC128201363 isoform X1 [Galleria mellonella]
MCRRTRWKASILSLQLLMLLFTVSFNSIKGHLVGDKAHLTELKKLCEHAYTCFHDTVIICGKSVNEARTFIDLCDLYEYSCEYNMVYRHVKEEDGVCPNPKELGTGIG